MLVPVRSWEKLITSVQVIFGQILRGDDFTGHDVMEDIWKGINEARIVIADVTGRNPNVFYELGIRHSISTGGTILIAHEGSEIPYDLSPQRIFFYNSGKESIESFKAALIKILQDHKVKHINYYNQELPDNPIRSFLEMVGAAVNPSKDIASFEEELTGRIKRAQNLEQLIAIWRWIKNIDPLPPFQAATWLEPAHFGALPGSARRTSANP